MKVFTKSWYAEMQVRGFLVFPETEQDWEEDVAGYTAKGLDFEKMRKEELEFRKADLLRFLPESFHPYIHDGTIISVFPSRELREMSERWKCDYNDRMKIISQNYRNGYDQIKDTLPQNATQLHEKSLHDAIVLSYESFSDDAFVLTLDCSGSYHYYTEVRLTFRGVTELAVPEGLVGAWWLYDEIYANEFGFELHVLLDMPLMELHIIAEDVLIEPQTLRTGEQNEA
ncbi:DUF4085 family protein [Cohnella herbarum]|uniref:DUF4085 family protein n=1 Tax=Cohnella herbarum TaxID=2728023 RepID=A0A7Z2ZJZ2_9BACL|nr:DUF4085 family protein [Cohnella herbarum]QJD82219.1 DUF4085 family protein [Cohnella herbarum]